MSAIRRTGAAGKKDAPLESPAAQLRTRGGEVIPIAELP
jgi:hypothetical protein